MKLDTNNIITILLAVIAAVVIFKKLKPTAEDTPAEQTTAPTTAEQVLNSNTQIIESSKGQNEQGNPSLPPTVFPTPV